MVISIYSPLSHSENLSFWDLVAWGPRERRAVFSSVLSWWACPALLSGKPPPPATPGGSVAGAFPVPFHRVTADVGAQSSLVFPGSCGDGGFGGWGSRQGSVEASGGGGPAVSRCLGAPAPALPFSALLSPRALEFSHHLAEVCFPGGTSG